MLLFLASSGNTGIIFCFNLVTSTVDELASLGAASPKVHLVEMEVTDYSSFSSVVDKVILMCFLKEEGGWELDSKDFWIGKAFGVT